MAPGIVPRARRNSKISAVRMLVNQRQGIRHSEENCLRAKSSAFLLLSDYGLCGRSMVKCVHRIRSSVGPNHGRGLRI